MKKKVLIFFTFFFGVIKQKPTPQLKVLNISFSDTPLLLIHLNIFFTFILDKSISTEKLLGTDLNKFSSKPPPVICAAAFIRFLFT